MVNRCVVFVSFFFAAFLQKKLKKEKRAKRKLAEQLLGMHLAGLKITAGQRTMSGQSDDLSGQNFGSAVILTGHVHGFQINNTHTKKNIRSIA